MSLFEVVIAYDGNNFFFTKSAKVTSDLKACNCPILLQNDSILILISLIYSRNRQEQHLVP